jgi:hypothetical protein
MGAGSHGKTSTIFYHRGVPNVFRDFGGLAAGNYVIFQPQTPLINKGFFSRRLSTIISRIR